MSISAHARNGELIAALILEAGRLAEDAAPNLARAWPEDFLDLGKRLDELAALADALTALAAAAVALHRGATTNSD